MKLVDLYSLMKEKLLEIYSSGEAEIVTDWTFEHFTGFSKMEMRLNKDKELTNNQHIYLNKALTELLQHKPVQYVLGEAWFYGMKFLVNESVLIPRPETEELVSEIIKKEIEIKHKPNKSNLLTGQHPAFAILDIGTGSGCIPISLKKKINYADITSIDISKEALIVAQQNAINLKAEINFIELDFLNENNWQQLNKYDIIVSNPPYIPLKEKAILDKHVTDWEPSLALFVADDDPFIFYNKIAQFAKTHLKEKGHIYLEIHQHYAAQTKALFNERGFVTEVKKDINGNDRIIKAERH